MRANLIWILLAPAALAAAGCALSQPSLAREDPGLHEARAEAARKAAIAEADFDEAMVLVADQRYAEAARRLSPLAAVFDAAEDRPRAARVTFWRAYCQEKQGRQAEAAALYERITRTYPQTPAARLAAERLARLQSPPTSR